MWPGPEAQAGRLDARGWTPGIGPRSPACAPQSMVPVAMCTLLLRALLSHTAAAAAVSVQQKLGNEVAPALEKPCDILGSAGNPCVAAHSTVRALYAKYAGPLYTVFHNQSRQSADIHVLQPGGFANAQQHEALCPRAGECVIARIIDQSGNNNHLTPRDDRGVWQRGRKPGAPPRFGHLHNPVDASRHKIRVGGNTTVYGMYFDPGMGYNNNRTKGVATGDGE
jgi:hypothetical protein